MPVAGTGAADGPRDHAGSAVAASPTVLRDLARRAREASEPDQELGEAVARALGWFEEGDLWWDTERSTSVYVLPAWTGELEAVVQWVVPAGWQWRIGSDNASNVWCSWPPEADVHDMGRTPALSLLAAAMEARALMADAEV